MAAAALSLLMPGLKVKEVAPFAAEKVNFGSPTRGLPNYDLPFIAAEEKGIWKSWGLEVNWVVFNATTPLVKALVSKDMDIGAASEGALYCPLHGIAVAISLAGTLSKEGPLKMPRLRSRPPEGGRANSPRG